MPLASATRRCAVSKFTAPRWWMSPSARSSSRKNSASSQDGSEKRQAWNWSRSMRSRCSRPSARVTAARTVSRWMGPGSGTHLVRSSAWPPLAANRPAISSAEP